MKQILCCLLKCPCNIIFSDVWSFKWQSAFYLFRNVCMLLMLQSSLANLNWLLGKWTKKRQQTRLLASAGSDRPANAVGFRCSISEHWNKPNCFQAGGSSFQLTCEFAGEVTVDKLHLRSSEDTGVNLIRLVKELHLRWWSPTPCTYW